VKVTVLGASAACPNAGGACSGYLIQTGHDVLLLDCGSGVVANLQKHASFHDLSAVLISHLHADHVLDLIPLRYGLRYNRSHNPALRLPLYLPPGGVDTLRKVVRPLDGAEGFFDDVFVLYEYDPDKELAVGGLTLHFLEVNHYVRTQAVRISAGGKVLVYSADTGPCQALVPFARGADLLICEATLQSREGASDNEWGHLAARETGAIAQRAGVKRLVLTHLWQQNDLAQLLQDARAVYDGPTDLAAENKVYRISKPGNVGQIANSSYVSRRRSQL